MYEIKSKTFILSEMFFYAMHDIREGAAVDIVTNVPKNLLFELKAFRLETLIYRIFAFNYGFQTNKPTLISSDIKIKMYASKMTFFFTKSWFDNWRSIP